MRTTGLKPSGVIDDVLDLWSGLTKPEVKSAGVSFGAPLIRVGVYEKWITLPEAASKTPVSYSSMERLATDTLSGVMPIPPEHPTKVDHSGSTAPGPGTTFGKGRSDWQEASRSIGTKLRCFMNVPTCGHHFLRESSHGRLPWPAKTPKGRRPFPVLAGSAAPLVTVVNATSMLTSDQKRGQVLIHDIIGKVKY